MRASCFPLLSLGGFALSETDAISIRDPGEKGQHNLSFSIQNTHKYLKARTLLVYSLNKHLALSSQDLGVECEWSRDVSCP